MILKDWSKVFTSIKCFIKFSYFAHQKSAALSEEIIHCPSLYANDPLYSQSTLYVFIHRPNENL